MSLPRACSEHLYDVLEVDSTASTSTIRSQYKKLALQYHPDKTNGTTHEKFQEIEEAHRILSDPEKRGLYNLLGRENLKVVGDNPATEMILRNPQRLIYTFAAFVFVSLCIFSSFCVGLWRYDKQFALASHSKSGLSWWVISIPFWPLILSVDFAAFTYIVQVFRREVDGDLLKGLLTFVVPLQILVLFALLSSRVSTVFAFLSLAVTICLYCGTQWRLINQENEEDERQKGRFFVKTGLLAVFLLLLFIRVCQQESRLSFWVINLPLIALAIQGLRENAVEHVANLYMLLFWTQKLNVELNTGSGYDPKAITASLPLFLALLVSQFVFILFFFGAVRVIRNVTAREEGDAFDSS